MIINLKVKTLDSQTHEFSIDNEITIRQFKDKISEKTNIAADQQRIIYCGRVLADEKQVKEYDVDGKVVHVAERPPPSARQPSSSTATGSDTRSGGTTPTNRRDRAGGMRTSPLFRALDGMVVGAMAIPMNAGVNNAQIGINPLTSSSSFCMNRITVARHMLDCANNIAAYLEDPDRGLNNSSLDILAQGRWTMESTVVEVGITTSDLPNQNLVEALQGAVTAALRRSGSTNLTVVQLPTVFGPSEGDTSNEDIADTSIETDQAVSSDTIPEPMDEGGVAIVIDTEESVDGTEEDNAVGGDEGIADSSSSTSSASTISFHGFTPRPTTVETPTETTVSATTSTETRTSTSGTTNTTSESSARRTSTRVLAEVVQQMRTVQARLNPFIDQYYDLLLNEPTFGEDETTRRENTQRLFDRVSEAFHYMSHAQHAISDLMLDVSQPTPRHLCCRPILVEQSGYVSSNNFTPVTHFDPSTGIGTISVGSGGPASRQHRFNASTPNPTPVSTSTPTPTSTATPSADTAAADNENANTDTSPVEDPVDEPISMPRVITLGSVSNPPVTSEATLDHHRSQVARMIEAVVNSAPLDTEFRVHINAPTIISIDNSSRASRSTSDSPATPAGVTSNEGETVNTTVTATSSEDGSPSVANASTSTNPPDSTSSTSSTTPTDTNQARVTTATLPTTSTQTRSTARPQVQVGNIPSGWNGRVIPANMMSSFDRFLPCNSHHIREPEHASGSTTPQNNNNVNNNNNENRREQREQQQEMLREMFRRIIAPRRSSASAAVASSSAITPTIPYATPSITFVSASQEPLPATNTIEPEASTAEPQRVNISSSTTNDRSASDVMIATDTEEFSENYRCIELRVRLLDFVKYKIFGGVPITEANMSSAINNAINWVLANLTFLPQFDLPEYDSQNSVEKLVRRSLPAIINLINDCRDSPTQFQRQLGILLEGLFNRLFGILFVCVGRINAELYWTQLMRILIVALNATFQSEVLSFLRIYVNTDIPTIVTNIADVQEFLVHRVVTPMETDQDPQTNGAELSTQSTSRKNLNNMSPPPPVLTPEPDEPLPAVIVGSETWHRNFPNNWLPIITRDIQRQRDASNSQAPFSDSYLSGMSAKRRKVIQNSKSPTGVKALVSDSVRRAIQTAGATNSTAANHSQTPEQIADAISTDSSVQASYCEALRTSVKDRIKTDPDYEAEKFPQTTKYLNK